MDILSGFKNTFNELLRERNVSEREFAKQLNTLPSVVSEWKNKSIDIKLKSLIKIADFFECSLEFLCGRSAICVDYSSKPCPPFGERLAEVLKEVGCSSYKLLKNTAISPAQYHYWRKGTEPRLTSLGVIADYLEISLDYLVGRER